MMTLTSKRRGKPRAPVRAPAQVTAGEARHEGQVLQLSESGLLLALDAELAPGTRLVAMFELPGFGPQRVVAEVRWAQKAEQVRAGCQFVSVTAQSQLQFGTFVKKVKQSYSQVQLGLAMNKPRPTLLPLLRELQLDHLDPQTLKATVKRAVADLSVAN